jgi:uncharacterized phage protein gp47/JayE
VALTTPALTDISTTLLRDIGNQLPDADVGKDSDNAIRSNAIASTVNGLYQHQKWIVRQMFPDTADHDYLVLHARTRNITQKLSTKADGSAIFTGTADTPLSPGLQFRLLTTGATYQTTAAGTIGADGTVTVPARALVAGTAGNLTENTPATLMTTPSGVDGTVTITSMLGGTEDETDTELLARLLEVIRRPAAGGNKYDYHTWAVSVSGVSEAYVYPLRRGYGTVDVVITSADGLPSEDTIAAVQAYIDDQRPVTAKNTLVLAPTVVTTDVTINITRSDSLSVDEAKTQIQSVVTSYFNRLAPSEIAVRSQIGALVSDIAGIVDYEIVTPASNVVPEVSATTVEWVRAGTISVGEMA